MKVKGIRDKWAALTVLSRLVLPSTSAINKVTALLKRFDGPMKAIEQRRKDVLAAPDLVVPKDWGRESLPIGIAEARARALDEVDAESITVKSVPDTIRLTPDDLPKVLKREGGEENVAGLAEIKKLLGGLYLPGEDEKKLEAEQRDGEEPDDYTPPAKDERAPAPAT